MRIIIIFGILVLFLQYIFGFFTFLYGFNLLIMFAWIIILYKDVSFGLIYLFPTSFINELMTIDRIGVTSLSLSISLILLYIVNNFLNLVSKESKVTLINVGFTINIVVYNLITTSQFNFRNIVQKIFAILFSIILFYIIINTVNKNNKNFLS